MCGRYSQTHSAETIAQAFQLAIVPRLAPRYNIAPTQPVETVLQTRDRPGRQFRLLRWGLIPSWAKDPTIGNRLINARSESVSEKPSFRSAFKYRRCLVIADGFYEWQQQASKQKQPFYFRLQDHQPFAFAGLWEHWQAPTGEEMESCTILTTTANEVLSPVHDRMPVILEAKDYDRWLDPDLQNPTQLQSLLKPYTAAAMESYPVSRAVNSPAQDTPECIQPLVSS